MTQNLEDLQCSWIMRINTVNKTLPRDVGISSGEEFPAICEAYIQSLASLFIFK